MIQSIIFDKSKYTLEEAKKWLEERNFKTDVDEKKNYYRFRQAEPNKRNKYITKPLTNGIKIILAFEIAETGKGLFYCNQRRRLHEELISKFNN